MAIVYLILILLPVCIFLIAKHFWETLKDLKTALIRGKRSFTLAQYYYFLASHPQLQSHAKATIGERYIYGPSFARKAEILYEFTAWDSKKYQGVAILDEKDWGIIPADGNLRCVYCNENPRINTLDDKKVGKKFMLLWAGMAVFLPLLILALGLYYYFDPEDFMQNMAMVAHLHR